ncbi:hypothetical protein JCM12296A_26010 [Desulfosarcina cetonica]
MVVWDVIAASPGIGFSTFAATPVRPNHTDATFVNAKDPILPIVFRSGRFRGGSGVIGLMDLSLCRRQLGGWGDVIVISIVGIECWQGQIARVGGAAFLTTAIGANDANAIAIAAQNTLVPFLIR